MAWSHCLLSNIPRTVLSVHCYTFWCAGVSVYRYMGLSRGLCRRRSVHCHFVLGNSCNQMSYFSKRWRVLFLFFSLVHSLRHLRHKCCLEFNLYEVPTSICFSILLILTHLRKLSIHKWKQLKGDNPFHNIYGTQPPALRISSLDNRRSQTGSVACYKGSVRALKRSGENGEGEG